MNPPSIEEQTPGEAHLDKTRLQATAPEPPAQQSLFAAPAVAPSDAGVEAAGRLAMRRTDTLKPHPSLLNATLLRRGSLAGPTPRPAELFSSWKAHG
jgi:hypothetical protein